LQLILVGTGHVLDLADAIRGLILRIRPTIVALELDADRYAGLLQRKASGGRVDPARRKDAGRVYRYLAKFQESVGESFGVQPGTEMLVAAEAAQLVNAKIALIDLNAQNVVSDAIRKMKFREKVKLLWSAIGAALPVRQKVHIEGELRKYQENPEHYLAELGREYPTIRRALIDDRDAHMAGRLRDLSGEPGPVVAIVGDGHIPGMSRLLADLKPEIHRLKDLRSRRPVGGMEWRMQGTQAVGFSFEGQSLESGMSRERF
jgi:pheromone shutdown protein TraB